MNCPKCGATLIETEDGRYYCEYCGANYKKKVSPAVNEIPVSHSQKERATMPVSTKNYSQQTSYNPPERKMYRNIGEKIKTLTAVVTVIGIIVSIILGIVALSTAADLYKELGERMPFSDGFVIFLIYFIAIPFGIWVSSFFAYGFGELVERTKRNNENSELIVKMLAEICEKESLKEAKK